MAAKIPVVLDESTPELEELQAGDTIAISLFTNDSNYLTSAEIDTLAELNAIISDATLIDTADSRLSDARTPTAHTHTESEITDLGNYVVSGGALGTPSSGALTNCTGLPTAGLVDDAVTYAKIQNVVNDDRVLGRVSGADGVIEELTAAQVHALIKSLVVIPIVGAASDETTDLTTGTAKLTFRMPYAFTLTDVRASVTIAPVGSTLTVDINENGTTILSTKLTIDASEKTSTMAATAAVISNSSLADDAEITIDIDQIGASTAGAGLKVYLLGYPT